MSYQDEGQAASLSALVDAAPGFVNDNVSRLLQLEFACGSVGVRD
jgi:hypothetical protein